MLSMGWKCIHLILVVGQVLCFVRNPFLSPPKIRTSSSSPLRLATSADSHTVSTRGEAIATLQSHHNLLVEWMQSPPSAGNLSQAIEGMSQLLQFMEQPSASVSTLSKELQARLDQHEEKRRLEEQADMLDQLCALYQHYVAQEKIGDGSIEEWYHFGHFVTNQIFWLRIGRNTIDAHTMAERLQPYDDLLGIDVGLYKKAHRDLNCNEIQSPFDQLVFLSKCESYSFDEMYQNLVATMLTEIKMKPLNKGIFMSYQDGIIYSDVVSK